jgi:hypothetical protein
MSYARVERGLMAADVIAQGFTQISNNVFRDPRISGLAMGVFGHISTHRVGYGITPESIARHMKNGVSAIKVALRELEKYGYLVRTQTRTPAGTMGPTIYKITDMPDGLVIVESAPYPQSSPRSAPSDGIRPPAPTCDDARLPSSEPSVGIPPAVKTATKKTSTKKTIEKNTSPPTPRESEPAGATAGQDGGRDLPDQKDETELLVDEVKAARPAWSRGAIRTALQHPNVLDRPRNLWRAAFLAVAADPATQSPGRLAHDGPWWSAAVPKQTRRTTDLDSADVVELAARREEAQRTVDASSTGPTQVGKAVVGPPTLTHHRGDERRCT